MSSVSVNCKICNSTSQLFSRATILEKYEVSYFQCTRCRFVQTEGPFWLAEAYQSPIAKADWDLLARNIVFAQLTFKVIANLFNTKARFLDYGSGYGTLVQLMYYLGLDFYGFDRYCEHQFALDRKIAELAPEDRYEMITAFEVLEHLPEPISDVQAILRYSDSLLFSTELLPDSNPKPQEWSYYALEEGQHISIYTPESLRILAETCQMNLYTNETSIHLLTKHKLSTELPTILDLNHHGIFPKLQEMLLRDVPVGLNLAPTISPTAECLPEKIIIDCVFFQYYQTGIARLWRSVLAEWSRDPEFAAHVTIIDRAGTAPKFPGFSYRTLSLHDYSQLERDRQLLQSICDEEKALIFASTYYTVPQDTPSVFIAYDMIPEVLGADLTSPMWHAKHHAIRQASAAIGISQNTAQDLMKFFPEIDPENVSVTYCGVDPIFCPATEQEIAEFRLKYAIQKPYFLLSSPSMGYKNAPLFFQALAQLSTRFGFEIVCTGSSGGIEGALRDLVPGNVIHALRFEDAELRLAFAGATALVYPSLYEGFGLPVLEAMACGCPVITTANASIPEVAGEAALYVGDRDISGLAAALCEVQKPHVRQQLIQRGLHQAQQFSWSKMAAQIADALVSATLSDLNLQALNLIAFPDWTQPEAELASELHGAIQRCAAQAGDRPVTLLLANVQLDAETANLLLTGIVMEALWSEELAGADALAVAVVKPLSGLQLSVLRPRLAGRWSLERECGAALAKFSGEDLPAIAILDALPG